MARESFWGPGRFLSHFYLIYIDIANYTDDNTPHVTADDINGVIASLENASNTIFKWFIKNLFKDNASKCHLLVICLICFILFEKDEVSLRKGDFNIVNSERMREAFRC